MKVRTFAILHALAGTAGLFFASYSTLDFVAHLDRQTHELHCSFVPGLVEASESHGCQATLMSPYSSLLRDTVWGGLPISLGAMAVFAFLLFRAVDLMGRPPAEQGAASRILLAFTFIPVVASAVMGTIAYTELHAACKLCIGIYVASGISLVAALGAVMASRGSAATAQPSDPNAKPTPPPSATRLWLGATAQSAAFVAVPAAGYFALAPDFSEYIGNCGSLTAPDDPYGVMVPLDRGAGGVETIEVFDPLCPACRGFEERIGASKLAEKLHRKALLFPLDAECNWMVPQSMHPGACSISEAVLCAHRSSLDTSAIIQWAFDNQEAIMDAERGKPGSASAMAKQNFPALAECIGSAEVKADLNQSLRWAVADQIPVLTPQLYVAGVKVCDADTDLGFDWAVTQLLAKSPRAVPSAQIATTAAPARPPEEMPVPKKKKGTKPAAPAETTAPEKAPPAESPKAPENAVPPTTSPTEPPKEPDVGPGKLPAVEQLPEPAPKEGEG